jgi:hypothetical protein
MRRGKKLDAPPRLRLMLIAPVETQLKVTLPVVAREEMLKGS